MIMGDHYDEAIEKPLLKGTFFLLGLLGFVDLAYDDPVNSEYPAYKKEYLSRFDGLKSIRLTPLGAHLLGKNPNFSLAETVEQATVHLDENYLIATLEGEDSYRKVLLQNCAHPIGEKRFKMDYISFFKGCTSLSDVKEKVALFKQAISE
jgi:hypothetical protein